MFSNIKFKMSTNTLLAGLSVIVLCCGYTKGAKVCETQIVSGAYYHDDVNGYYDYYPDFQCHGRDVYKQRDPKPGNDQMYIYYYRYSALKRGWLIGTSPCSNDRRFADLYVWNVNQRPDRVLLSWIEYNNENLYWYYNRHVNVVCTEGLTYPQIVGIIVGCFFGFALLVGLLMFAYYKIQGNKRGSRPSSPDPVPQTQVTYTAPAVVTTHVVDIGAQGGYPSAPPSGQVHYQYTS